MHRDRDVTHLDVLSFIRFVPLIRRGVRWRVSVLLLAGLYGSLIVGANACSSDATGPKRPPLTSAQAFWSLQLNQHAVMMALTAPVSTIQLSATPLNADGNPISNLGPVYYTTVTGDSVVRVDSNGLVTAQFASQTGVNSFVIASLTDRDQGVTLVDTCFIQVTETAPNARLASFSIQPVDGDIAKRNLVYDQIVYTAQANATDGSGATFTNFFTYFYSTNTSIATINKLNGNVRSANPGHVTFYAQTWSYGVAALDSLQFEIGQLQRMNISILALIPTGSTKPILTFSPQSVTIGVGGSVIWSNPSYTDSIDVVFDDPADVDSFVRPVFGFATGRGNIPPWVYDTLDTTKDSVTNKLVAWDKANFAHCNVGQAQGGLCGQRNRLFPVAGVYHYHSVKQHTSGTIIVR